MTYGGIKHTITIPRRIHKMTRNLQEYLDILNNLFPDIELEEDLEGEVIIYTGVHFDFQSQEIISMDEYKSK